MKDIYDVLIIGGGPAGYTAALYAARAGFSTAVIEKMGAGGQMSLSGNIENYPGFDMGIEGAELGFKMQSGAERFGAETVYAEVIGVDFSADIKKVETDSASLGARTVVIATGAYPRALDIEGEAERYGRGVHYCAHCDGGFYKGKKVAVIGGGNSAAEDASHLSRIAEKVMLIHRRDKLRAERVYENRLKESRNVELVFNSVPERIVFDDNGVRGIEVTDKEKGDRRFIECDAVFVSIGRRPESELFRGKLDMDEDGYILADETTRTSVEGVYAVGDVRRKPLRQIVTAVSDGAVAIHCAEEYLASKFGI